MELGEWLMYCATGCCGIISQALMCGVAIFYVTRPLVDKIAPAR